MDEKEFLEQVKSRNPHVDSGLIRKAFEFARKAHEGQKRVDGSPYINHPIQAALILNEMLADTETICAALLHDTMEDTGVSEETLKKEFGKEVAKLVVGVTKKSKFYFQDREAYTADNLRKILLATTKDVRVMMIKLADKLHNMRTIKDFREEKQRRTARQTLQIYAPIAEKLGLYDIKGELEDLSLKILNPEIYADLKAKISEKRSEREKKTEAIIGIITELMKKNNITCKVTGRAKYFYSIYKKMKLENKTFDDIYDLIGVRIITVTEGDCYKAQALFHREFRPIKEKFKDYIKEPKENGYQSIHTSVYGPFNKILEIQIRTLQMHYDAESGPASHWKYKGTERDKLFDKKINWLRELLAWLRESGKGTGLIEDLKIDLFENEIIIFTPKGDPISLPENATSIDFAYEVHTNLGQHAIGCTVNRKSVSLGEKLQSGDVVEIITSKNAEPNRNWLNFAITTKARSKIKNYLNVASPSSKKLRLRQEADDNAPLSEAALLKRIIVSGAKGHIKISGCCNPNYGDSICGYRVGEGIAIHKTDCPNAKALDEGKRVSVDWKEDEDANVKEIIIYCQDRIGLLAQVLNTASAINGIKITAINTKPKKDKIEILLHLTISDKEAYDKFASEARKIKGVMDVQKEE